jgi:site-specific recombinase XerC
MISPPSGSPASLIDNILPEDKCMPTIKYRVQLSEAERTMLLARLQDPGLNARKAMHVRILLLADENRIGPKLSEQAIGQQLSVNSQTVHTIRRRFALEGLEAAIQRKPRAQARVPRRINDDVCNQILALSQSQPPSGCSRWTLRLLAHHAQELQIIDRISHETVGQLLKKSVQQGIN